MINFRCDRVLFKDLCYVLFCVCRLILNDGFKIISISIIMGFRDMQNIVVRDTARTFSHSHCIWLEIGLRIIFIVFPIL